MTDLLLELREAQYAAATARGEEVVVTAGAGTGKTFTLTARVLHLLQSAPKTSLDRLLLITFTKNAAAEMRERIAHELEVRVWKEPNKRLWRVQRAALGRSSIGTLDSFCLDTLRSYIHVTDLDPEVQPLNEDDATLLEADTLSALFEEFYAKESPEGEVFRRLAEHLGGRDYDGGLAESVRKLHALRQVRPDPGTWTEELRRTVQQTAQWREGSQTLWSKAVEDRAKREIAYLEQAVKRALSWTQKLEAESVYGAHLTAIHDRVGQVLAPSDAPLMQRVQAVFESSGKLPSRSGENDLEDTKKALLKPLADSVGKRVKKICNGLLPLLDSALEEFVQHNTEEALGLLQLVEEHAEAYQRAKANERVIDFNDIEQETHRLLAGEPEIVERLRARYHHVLVDEVQDINRLQDDIILQVARPKSDNLFCVGDVKQSIYGFRQAEPQILLERLARAGDISEEKIKRVDLQENFRSRATVIDAVNGLFGHLMQEELGGVEYDDRAELVARTELYPGPDPPVALVVIEKEKPGQSAELSESEDAGESRSDAEFEADVLAERLLRILHGDEKTPACTVTDRSTKEERPVRQSDIAVLLRSPGTRGEVFAERLTKAGLNVFTDQGGGFFDTPEIREMEAALQSIENPCRDIALAAYLSGPLGGATISDIVRARQQCCPVEKERDAETPLIAVLQTYVECGSDGATRERLRQALERLESWRRASNRKPLGELVWSLLHDTGYLAYATSQPLGAQRRANLLDLVERARQASQFRTAGLSRFLRSVEHLKSGSRRIRPPSPLSESDDVIRIMSVHAAKGLEFPIVALPQLGSRFNLRDAQDTVILDGDLGPCMNHVIDETGTRTESLTRDVAKERKALSDRAEELRILYVALTRARERLLLIGTANWDGQPHKWYGAMHPEDMSLHPAYLEAQLTPLDWIAPAALCTGAAFEGEPPPESLRKEPNPSFELTFIPIAERLGDSHARPENDTGPQPTLFVMKESEEDRAYVDEVVESVRWRYPFAEIAARPSKATVSDLKRARETMGEQGEVPHPALPETFFFEPARERRAASDAARRGTITHRFLQFLDFKRTDSTLALETQRSEMLEQKRLSEQEAKLVDLDTVSWFFTTELGQRLAAADEVQRELPFTLGMQASEVWPELEGEQAKELVHVQGVMDALLVGERILLVDYKTDRVPNGALPAYADRYAMQMRLYRRAVEAIFDRPSDEALLVFLSAREVVRNE